MKRELITVNRKDELKKYQDFLTGKFSKSQVAIPVQAALSDKGDLVTFEIINKSALEVPSGVLVWLFALRPLTLILTLGSSLAAMAYIGFGELNISLVFGVLVVALLQISINLFNDYNDHMSGTDRTHLSRGSRSIQKGFLRAIDVRNVAICLLSLAVGLGLYVLVGVEKQVWFFALAGVFGAFVFKQSQIHRPIVGLEELASFLITGPVIFHGLLSLVGVRFNFETILISVFLGMNSSIYFHISKWQGIFEDRKTGGASLANSLGTDLSKLVAIWTILLSIFPIIGVAYLGSFQILDLICVGLVFLNSVKMALAVRSVTSPFSSQLRNIRRDYLIHNWIQLAFLIVWLALRVSLIQEY